MACNRDRPIHPLVSAALADTTCAFVAETLHPDALPLAQEFVERDARGEFRAANAWFNSAVTCPGHEPGPDAATVVRAHSIRLLVETADSARFEVTWERVGYSDARGEVSAPGTDFDTLFLLRTPFGWRVSSPALDPHAPVPPPQARP